MKNQSHNKITSTSIWEYVRFYKYQKKEHFATAYERTTLHTYHRTTRSLRMLGTNTMLLCYVIESLSIYIIYMCSFLIYNFLVESLSKYDYFLKFRGPDYTNTYKHNFKNLFFTFLHNLLNITGSVTYQPFIKNDIICLYNGEIYNHK